MWRKILNMSFIFGLTIVAFGMLMVQTVFWAQMEEEMGLTVTELTNAQSAQLAGLAVGCLLFIPFSVKYGRRPAYIISTAALTASAWWSARITTFWELIVSMLLCGLAGAINETLCQMTIADLFFVHQRGLANTVYFVGVTFGSFLCPLAAGVQATAYGWRWSYYTFSICLTILFLAFCVLYEETKYVPVSVGTPDALDAVPGSEHDLDKDGKKTKDDGGIDIHRAQSRVSRLGTYRVASYRQRMRMVTKTDESLWKLFMLPFPAMTLPHMIYTSLQFALGVAALVTLSSMTSIVFSMPPYNFDASGVGYMTLGPVVGNIFGSIYAGPFSDWWVVRSARRNGGLFEPEMRLNPLCVSTVAYAGGLAMFGVTADRGMHWIYPSIGGALFAFGFGSTGAIAFTLLIDTYRDLTAEVFVGVAFFRNAVSIGIASAVVPWWTSMGLSNMFIMLGMLSFGICLLYVPLVIWGKQIRVRLHGHYENLIAKKGVM
ncbi:hypothetical protein E8E14_008886 [Neopestalotiopsis sp. 37M]|nr:hypothetical protein E8E14_008886 [Neopestalotiopsis sp. 37M]